MNKRGIINLYKINKISEVILFSCSVVLINILLSEKLYWWVLVVAIIILTLEIFIKHKEYNPIIKQATKREQKIKQIENHGITNQYFMNNNESKSVRNSETAKAIDKSNEMHLIAETGKSYLDIPTDRHWKNIKEKLDEGIHFRVLLINPYCDNKSIRNEMNNVEGADRKLDIENIIKLMKRYENLEIKFTDQVYCSLFFTDKYMIYDPYHLGKIADRIENNFIAIEFNCDNRNYNILKSHFNNCWKYALSFKEVIK
ncbi:hypothetical protein [Halobacillus naozhouensis]|uniref:Uncharacterized protein n=1 Tax=Halobacillus naozhouensis TaxID=554880 RepID=A0ABY8J608_9BACI|nr:hypothetical protein [Halobacillus naozhouensis]WFT76205.1 hypothetical protein P9989_07530 [Halobacillus naozhouensis]